MAPSRTCLVVLACLAGGCAASQLRQGAVAEKNPIRRVVDLLQKLQAKVDAEGKSEKKLFDAFMCYCKTGKGDLSGSISSADTKIPQVEAALEQAKALKSQLEGELTKHKADRQDAKDTIAQATALREKEAAEYAQVSSDLKTNVDALGKAVASLSKGVGSFLQTGMAARLRQLSITVEMSATDRDLLSAFLSQGQSSGYVPQSGAIIGILKQLQESFDKNLAETVASEQQAIEIFKSLVAAKEAEIEANTQAVESKLTRVGELGVEIVNLAEDLDDTQKLLLQDRQFLADLEKGCDTKEKEWDERSKTRADELLALADTIKLLNSDDALDLFGATLPSPALLQVQVSSKQAKQQALQVLSSGHKGDFRMDLISLALKGRGAGFEQVSKLIDDLVKVLGEEQESDDSKKAYCESELDKAEDAKKVLDLSAHDLEVAIEEATGSIASLAEEIAALEKGIADLDNQVEKATAARKAEHEEYVKTSAANTAAKDLLELAKNRLAKFYTPKLYKEPPKEELSKEARIVASMGGFVQAAPPPPPATWGAYQTKGEEHQGVIALLDSLKADLDKELQEGEFEEKDSQAEYEQLLKDSASKRAADTASVTQKESTKADLEVEVQRLEGQKKSTVAEAMAKGEYIANLHQECDWLVANYEVRKEARTGEVDSLKKAKAVLAGADYSLVQQAAVRRLRGASA